MAYDEFDLREDTCNLIGCCVEELDDEPELVLVTNLVYQGRGAVTFSVNEGGGISIFWGEDFIGSGDNAADALQDALLEEVWKRPIRVSDVPAMPMK